MQLNAFGAALLRRWYLVVLSLGLAVAASAYVVSDVGPTYEVEGTVLLFPPTSSTTSGDQSVTQGNPYLYLGGLNPARDVLIRSLTSRSERDSLAAVHPGADYTMESDISTSGPLIVIDVSSGSSAESVAALSTLLDRIPAALDALQADIGHRQRRLHHLADAHRRRPPTGGAQEPDPGRHRQWCGRHRPVPAPGRSHRRPPAVGGRARLEAAGARGRRPKRRRPGTRSTAVRPTSDEADAEVQPEDTAPSQGRTRPGPAPGRRPTGPARSPDPGARHRR